MRANKKAKTQNYFDFILWRNIQQKDVETQREEIQTLLQAFETLSGSDRCASKLINLE